MLELLPIFIVFALLFLVFRFILFPLVISFIVFFVLKKKISKRKNILVTLAVFVLLLVVFYFLSPVNIIGTALNPIMNLFSQKLSDCDKITIAYQRDVCVEEYAVKHNDISVCYLISDKEGYQRECVHTLSKKQSDVPRQ